MDKIIVEISRTAWVKVLVVGLILGGCYYAFLFNDGSMERDELVKAANEKKGLQAQLKATKEAAANADRFEREVKEMADQFSRMIEYMPEKMSGVELTSLVSDLGAKAGVRVVKTEPALGVEKADFYDTSRLKMELEGSFSQVTTFLSYLSRTAKLMTLEDVILSNPGPADVESPKLKFEATLVAYRYIRPKDEKGGKADDKKAPAAPPVVKAPNAP